MGEQLSYKAMVEKAKVTLKELVSGAEGISFEEIGVSNGLDNPPNATVVVLSYRDPSSELMLGGIFSRKQKAIYLDSATGNLLAIKNRLA